MLKHWEPFNIKNSASKFRQNIKWGIERDKNENQTEI